MRKLSEQELKQLIKERSQDVIDLNHSLLENMDLSGWDLHKIDFSDSDFRQVNMAGADLSGSSLRHTFFTPGTSFRGTNFKNADISESIFRSCDFFESNMEGANLYCSNFEHSVMEPIKINEQTRHFRMHCPETGPFVGYKRCFNDTLVQLLIPADARRTSATNNACRCDKAKVLSIRSFDGQRKLPEAWSVVDENFVYRPGEYVTADNFNDDRWMESTTGIHFWMTREEAYGYLE